MLEAWTLRQDSVSAEEERLKELIRDLNDNDRAIFFRQYKRLLRDPDTYAVLNWCFLAGLHHYYLGRYLRGSVNLLVMVAGVFLLFSQPVMGMILIGGIFLIELPALFRSQVVVADHNTKIGYAILESEGFMRKSR